MSTPKYLNFKISEKIIKKDASFLSDIDNLFYLQKEGLGYRILQLRQWLPVSLHILRIIGIAGSNPCAFTTLGARTAVTTCMRVGEGQVCTLG